jgi:hypothetical protein
MNVVFMKTDIVAILSERNMGGISMELDCLVETLGMLALLLELLRFRLAASVNPRSGIQHSLLRGRFHTRSFD